MKVGELVGQDSIDLLRIRIGPVMRAQASFNVPDFHAVVKGSERGRENGRCVGLDQMPVGFLAPQDRLKAAQYGSGDIRWRLVVLHDVKIVVWPDVEDVQDLI